MKWYIGLQFEKENNPPLSFNDISFQTFKKCSKIEGSKSNQAFKITPIISYEMILKLTTVVIE